MESVEDYVSRVSGDFSLWATAVTGLRNDHTEKKLITLIDSNLILYFV